MNTAWPFLPTAVSVAALTISLITAWLTFFRKGTIRMTQPTVVYFGPDAGQDEPPKVYFRALLFATAKRGRVLESMYVRLRRDDTTQNFTVWVHGDGPLVRGSGMFVPETGVVTNHHFLIAQRSTPFAFVAGPYEFAVFASVVGMSKKILLFSTSLDLSHQSAVLMADGGAGVYFDWSADTRRYTEHVRRGPALTQGTAALPSAG